MIQLGDKNRKIKLIVISKELLEIFPLIFLIKYKIIKLVKSISPNTITLHLFKMKNFYNTVNHDDTNVEFVH